MLGSQVGFVVKQVDPSFQPANFGLTKLSEFIAEHIPQVRPVGTSGLDIVYGLAGWPSVQDASLDTWMDPWRVWTSPNSRQIVAVDRQSLRARVSTPAAVSPSEIAVHPAPASTHLAIAKAFLATDEVAAAPLLGQLSDALNARPDSWWRAWQDELRGTELQSAWLAFRHEKLREALVEALVSAGMPGEDAFAVIRMLRQRPTKARRASAQALSGLRNSDIATLVHQVVDRMTDDDLRRLSLPLGLVLDAMHD